MRKENGNFVERPVATGAGLFGKSSLVVLIVATILIIGFLAMIYIGLFVE